MFLAGLHPSNGSQTTCLEVKHSMQNIVHENLCHTQCMSALHVFVACVLNLVGSFNLPSMLFRQVMSTFCIAGGQILASDAIRTAYQDGRGSIPVRGKAAIEGDPLGLEQAKPASPDGNGSVTARPSKSSRRKRQSDVRPAVVITQLPYQANKVC